MQTSTALCVCILILGLTGSLSDIEENSGLRANELLFLSLAQLALEPFLLVLSPEVRLAAPVVLLPLLLLAFLPKRRDAFYSIPVLLLCFGPIAALCCDSPLPFMGVSGLATSLLFRSSPMAKLLAATLIPVIGIFFRGAIDIIMNNYTSLFLEQAVMDAQIGGLCIAIGIICLQKQISKRAYRI